MKLFKSFTAIKALCLPVFLCAGGPGTPWVCPVPNLSAVVPFRSAANANVLSHSHNDYEQKNPLLDALMHGFDSVEADIWLRGDRFVVSHMGWSTKGTLEELYLDPLQRLVEERGSVYGDGGTFYIWIDIKRYEAGLAERLQRALSRYPMLSRFGADGERTGAVTVILTGSERAKSEYARRNPVRFATRDSLRFERTDPPADGTTWSWYSLEWPELFKWEGRGPMPPEERRRLKDLVSEVHAKGRRVRFWAVPQTDGFWTAAAEAGVDSLQTDSLPSLQDALSRFRRSGSGTKEPERAVPSASLRLLTGDPPLGERPGKDTLLYRNQ